MASVIVLPGYGNSGPGHWQTLWERADPEAARFAPADWEAPDLADWLAALDRAVAAAPEPPLLLAHSLSCLLVAHWAARGPSRGPTRAVAGAFLVAAPDPDGPVFPKAAASFRPVPDAPLPFPAVLVASRDDPYGTPAYAEGRARAWGAGLVWAGTLGHINAASGLGDWPQGQGLLAAFRAGLRRP